MCDETCSRLIAAALAADLAGLAFLVHRRWPPYSKWLGSMLAALPSARRAPTQAGHDKYACMAVIVVTAEKTVDAPADTVFGYIRDMREHHPKFLPPEFSDFQVESGGVGPGTITRFTVKAGGRTRNYRMQVDEPEPGRVITESDTGSSLVTKTTVTPKEGGVSLVEIATSWQGAGGIGGFFERTFAPRVMHSIYEDELNRLDAYARERRAS